MLLFIADIVVCIIAYFIMKATDDKYSNAPFIVNVIFTIIFIATFICAIGCLIAITVNHVGSIAEAQAIEVQRDSLIYQYNNQLYLNDINYGANELFNQITEFNERVRGKQAMAKSLWTNWFIPPYWKNVELIPFN